MSDNPFVICGQWRVMARADVPVRAMRSAIAIKPVVFPHVMLQDVGRLGFRDPTAVKVVAAPVGCSPKGRNFSESHCVLLHFRQNGRLNGREGFKGLAIGHNGHGEDDQAGKRGGKDVMHGLGLQLMSVSETGKGAPCGAPNRVSEAVAIRFFGADERERGEEWGRRQPEGARNSGRDHIHNGRGRDPEGEKGESEKVHVYLRLMSVCMLNVCQIMDGVKRF